MNNILNVNFKGKITYLENNKKIPLKKQSMYKIHNIKMCHNGGMGGCYKEPSKRHQENKTFHANKLKVK